MSKQCARCDKTVYPIEELKCLDKVWHKQCFKCQACNMTLNMRNYKGFNKNPYCEAHVPKAKATTVAETPELKRIAENTKLQSNVKYHAAFEKAKGKLTQVADDPETLRIKQNSKNISNVAYHGELQKKAEMEQRRNINDNANVEDGLMAPPPVQESVQQTMPQMNQQHMMNQQYNQQYKREMDHLHNNTVNNSPYSARQTSTVIYTSDRGPVLVCSLCNLPMSLDEACTCSPVNNTGSRQVGSIADFDPVNNYYGSLGPAHRTDQPPRSSGRVYRAMYDYEAQDGDEVSFMDGDLIIDCKAVDSGWMTGCVQRTGQVGMLPANYVQPAL